MLDVCEDPVQVVGSNHGQRIGVHLKKKNVASKSELAHVNVGDECSNVIMR